MEINSYDNLDQAINKFKEINSLFKKERLNKEEFVKKYLTNSELRPHLKILYDALERMSLYSIDDFEKMSEKGASLVKSPRYDFSCLEETAKEMIYTFSTGESKFICNFSECLENIVNFLYNYKAVLKYEEFRTKS